MAEERAMTAVGVIPCHQCFGNNYWKRASLDPHLRWRMLTCCGNRIVYVLFDSVGHGDVDSCVALDDTLFFIARIAPLIINCFEL